MGILNFTKTTLRELFNKNKITLQYPIQEKEPYAGQKGHIVIDEGKCILCSKCAKSCPADALIVDRKEKLWSINYFRCVMCNSCVKACPKKCLKMDPHRINISRNIVITKHYINEKGDV